MFGAFKKLLGDSDAGKLRPLYAIVERINALEAEYKAIPDAKLKHKTAEFRQRLGVPLSPYSEGENERGGAHPTLILPLPPKDGSASGGKEGRRESLDDLLPEAFALVRESARRTLGERHFDVQLLGGMVLHHRGIAEMRTGEGKTLVATLPAYLNALEGKGVHVVTVNDYLSRRDAVWMGQIYHLLGLTVGVINHDSSFLYDPSHHSVDQAGGNPKSPARLRMDEVQAGGQIPNDTPVSSPRNLSPTVIGERGSSLDSRLHGNDSQGDKDKLDQTRDELGSFKVVHEFLRPCTRREAYLADITYGTNNEFGFDYLRDNLEYLPDALRQSRLEPNRGSSTPAESGRDFNYAIVDEVDSILIDEARTPLIISAPTADSENLYGTFAGIAASLSPQSDYTVDEKLHAIQVMPSGIEKTEKALGVGNIYTERGVKFVHHLETAVRAKALFHSDKHYVVKDGEVIIVDEFTGRLQPGRRWSEGLHQAIEAKEGVAVQKESRTFGSITFQNYFRMYKKLAGMTGTAKTSSEEFYKVYGLDVVSIPTNKPSARADRNDLIFQTETGKFKALARKVSELHKKGQPSLIGTVSIEKNEVLSEYLRSVGVPHEVLNAKNHEREGTIIAQAGRKGAVTVATNMAGRGVDIKLGGNPATKEEYESVKTLGGLFVLGTERHEARRIDNQLRGRSGRQGDPGETQFFVSMEDTLMRVFARDTIKNMMGRFGIPEDEPIENRIITRSLETAQTKIEGFHFDARKHVLEYDDVLNHQRKTIYERRRHILLGGPETVDKYLAEVGNSPFVKGSTRPAFSEKSGGGGILSPLIRGALPTPPRAGGVSEDFAKIIEQKKQHLGPDFYPIAQRLILQSIDLFWVEHLEVMDYLRGSVNLRAYGQRDPLVEYKREGLRLFKEMEEGIANQIMTILPQLGGQIADAPRARLQEVHEQAQLIGSGDEESDPSSRAQLTTGHSAKHHGNIPLNKGGADLPAEAVSAQAGSARSGDVSPLSRGALPSSAGGVSPFVKGGQGVVKNPDGSKLGRNDPCHCGSGKKYKKCHGA